MADEAVKLRDAVETARSARDREKSRAYDRAVWWADPEKARAKQRAYRALHPEVARKYELANPRNAVARRATYERNKGHNQAYARNRLAAARAADPQKVKDRDAAYRLANPAARCARQMARHCAKIQRTPAWSDLAAIKLVYVEAAKRDLTVDHIVPLQGTLVSGLHVSWNLQMLTTEENCRKGNRFVVE